MLWCSVAVPKTWMERVYTGEDRGRGGERGRVWIRRSKVGTPCLGDWQACRGVLHCIIPHVAYTRFIMDVAFILFHKSRLGESTNVCTHSISRMYP